MFYYVRLEIKCTLSFIRNNWDNEDADNARSRQQSQAAPGAACSRQESPAVVRMKRFCLEFFFLYTESFFCIFYLIPLTSLF